jgi:hypothetical protein
MLNNFRLRNTLVSSLALLVFFAAVLACRSSSSTKCSALVTYEGTTYQGSDAEKEKAISNACNNYCRDADAEYDAMYRVWVVSPAGRAAGQPSKHDAIFKDSKLMDFVTITCSNRCVAWTRDGTARLDTKCE